MLVNNNVIKRLKHDMGWLSLTGTALGAALSALSRNLEPKSLVRLSGAASATDNALRELERIFQYRQLSYMQKQI